MDTVPEIIAKEGYVLKKNHTESWFTSGFSNRYFTISDQCLAYYGKQGGELKVMAPLSAVAAAIEESHTWCSGLRGPSSATASCGAPCTV